MLTTPIASSLRVGWARASARGVPARFTPRVARAAQSRGESWEVPSARDGRVVPASWRRRALERECVAVGGGALSHHVDERRQQGRCDHQDEEDQRSHLREAAGCGCASVWVGGGAR